MFAFNLLLFCFLLELINGAVEHKKLFGSEGKKPIVEKFIGNNEESKTSSEDLLFKSSSINDTGLKFGSHYYLIDRSGLYLSWNGKNSISSPKMYGLTVDSFNSSIDVESYIFVIEPFGSTNDIAIKNVKTGQYITRWSRFFYLMNENSSNYPIRLRLVIQENNLINIQSVYQDYPYYLSTNIWYTGSDNGSINCLEAISNISDSSVAYISFIPVGSLYTRINNFTYETLSLETARNYLTQVNLISPTYINNTSPSKITHEVLSKKTIRESLDWKFDQNLTFIAEVTISKELPTLVTRNGGFENSKSIIKLKSSTNKESRDIVNENEYIVKKTVEIPPNSSVKIQAFVNKIEDLRLRFTAIAVITGEDHNGVLSGLLIQSIINYQSDANFTIVEVDEFSVRVRVDGILKGSFILNNQFIVANIDSIENWLF